MRKHIISFIFVIFIMVNTYANVQVWGIKTGIGLAQGYGCKDQAEEYDVKLRTKVAYQAGAYMFFPITESFGIQNEILYSKKGSRQDIIHKEEPVSMDVRYDLDYLEVPFMIKLRLLQTSGNSFWSMTGFSFSYLFNSRYDLEGTVNVGDEIFDLKESYKLDMIDEFDFALLYGFALHTELFDLPIRLEYRFSLGWQKISFPTYQNEDPVKLNNLTYQIILSTPIF